MSYVSSRNFLNKLNSSLWCLYLATKICLLIKVTCLKYWRSTFSSFTADTKNYENIILPPSLVLCWHMLHIPDLVALEMTGYTAGAWLQQNKFTLQLHQCSYLGFPRVYMLSWVWHLYFVMLIVLILSDYQMYFHYFINSNFAYQSFL